MSEWVWIPIGIVAAVWFFSLLEDWADIGQIDADEPEDQ